MPVTRTAGQPFTVVDAPARVPYTNGLLSVLDFGDGGAQAGLPIQWDSMGCMVPFAVQDVCFHGASPHAKTDTISCGAMFSTGFTVVAFDSGSIGDVGINSDRVRAQLDYAEQVTVEGHFLKLLAENDVPAPAVSGTSPFPARSALATIESALASRGAQGAIIMSRFLASLLSDHLVAGIQLQTKLGTPVAALGIPFPNGVDPLLMFGVTGLRGVRGPVTDAAVADRGVNDVSAFAERDYSIGFECEAFSALATTTL